MRLILGLGFLVLSFIGSTVSEAKGFNPKVHPCEVYLSLLLYKYVHLSYSPESHQKEVCSKNQEDLAQALHETLVTTEVHTLDSEPSGGERMRFSIMTSPPMIVFRGTVTAEDWVNNVKDRGAGYLRATLKTFSEIESRVAGQIKNGLVPKPSEKALYDVLHSKSGLTLSGLSLGGSIAQNMALWIKKTFGTPTKAVVFSTLYASASSRGLPDELQEEAKTSQIPGQNFSPLFDPLATSPLLNSMGWRNFVGETITVDQAPGVPEFEPPKTMLRRHMGAGFFPLGLQSYITKNFHIEDRQALLQRLKNQMIKRWPQGLSPSIRAEASDTAKTVSTSNGTVAINPAWNQARRELFEFERFNALKKSLEEPARFETIERTKSIPVERKGQTYLVNLPDFDVAKECKDYLE